MEKITSLQNQQVKRYVQLHQKKYRVQYQEFLIEGEHLIQEAIKHGALKTLIYSQQPSFHFDHGLYVSQEVMDKIAMNVSQTTMIGVCNYPKPKPFPHHRILILDGIQDPGNLGTLIRSAVSFGYDGIYCSLHTCDFLNEKVIRSTQGAIFQIPIVYQDLQLVLQELKAQHVQCIATSLQQAIALRHFQPNEHFAVILGNEGSGVSKEVLEQSDACVKIEMAAFESLNVAIAGSILMYTLK